MGSSDETFTIYGYERDTNSIKEATTNLYDSDDCEDFLTKYNFDHTISFQDSFCYNDSSNHVSNFVSGTPILVKEDNKYYQYGISTLGTLRREKDQPTPAISPILSIYQGWILHTVSSCKFFFLFKRFT